MALLIKNLNGLAYANVKNRNGLVVASIKSINGLDATSSSPITFSDNFSRANENPLSKSGAWTNGLTSYNNLTVFGNTMFGSTVSANNGQIVTTPDFTAYTNQSASIQIPLVSQLAAGTLGVLVRFSVSGNGYRLSMVNTTSARMSVINGGTATALGADYSFTPVNNDVITLGIVGTTLTCYLNGVQQGTTRTDGTHASGSPGAYGFSNTVAATFFSCTSL